MKVKSAIAATPPSTRISTLSLQPSRLPSSSTYCSDAMPTASRPIPTASIRAVSGTKPGSSSTRGIANATASPIGTLTRKIQCQLAQSIM